MNIDDLRRVIVAAAGADETLRLAGDITDTPFEELGYDSLALMECAALVEQEYGVSIPEDELAEARTPGALLALVNGSVAR
ncbi:acyl carrier protein [Actinokineospora sp. NBRC 105648]|uniref:acyl carrier protein n=1 Tax=Actinokineospora sp. NBRC 105648 TaxID=3032206 RepID=UPI0025534678|nr:acyl carrier protein [Actinokineospora sp. NBRC 105648]